MKQILQIVGAEVISKDMVKLTLIPYTSKEVQEKRPSLFELAKGGGGVQQLIEQTQSLQKQKSILFVSLDDWLNTFKNKPISKVSIDIQIEQLTKDY